MTYADIIKLCNEIDFKVAEPYIKSYIAKCVENIDTLSDDEFMNFMLNLYHPECNHYTNILDYIKNIISIPILDAVANTNIQIFNYLYPNVLPTREECLDASGIIGRDEFIEIHFIDTPFYLRMPTLDQILCEVEFDDIKKCDNTSQMIDNICVIVSKAIPNIVEKAFRYVNLCYYTNIPYSIYTYDLSEDKPISYMKLNTILFLYNYHTYRIVDGKTEEQQIIANRNNFIDIIYDKVKLLK